MVPLEACRFDSDFTTSNDEADDDDPGIVAAEATALDGTLVPLGPPVGGLGDDRSDY